MKKEFHIDPKHPSLAGHFPDNPIVPGVVILGEVLEHMGKSLGQSFIISKIPSVKFHSPLRPNEQLLLTFDILPNQLINFSCQVGSRRIASGQIIIQAHEQVSLSTQ